MNNQDFISTKDLDEVARIHSDQKYINWKMEYEDGEYRFYPPAKQQEDTYVTLEQLEPLLSESGYMCFGHGTGANSIDIVNSIFTEGLRTKDNSLYYTTIALSTPTPEIKKQYKESGHKEPSIDDLKHQFNNWTHKESKKIIIARIPTEYINQIGDRSDRDGERYGAFYTPKKQPDGKKVNYLDPKFIIGCFDVEKQLVRLNKNFEKTLTPATIEKLKEGYQQALAQSKERIETIIFPFAKSKVETPVPPEIPIQKYELPTSIDDLDFDAEEWEDTETDTKSR